MIKKKFKTPLYGHNFTAIIYNSDEELTKMFKNKEFVPEVESFDGGVFWCDDEMYIVFSAEKKGYPTPGIIAHEAKHLVNNIFLDIGHELDLRNDEPECYLLTWIVNRIHEMIK